MSRATPAALIAAMACALAATVLPLNPLAMQAQDASNSPVQAAPSPSTQAQNIANYPPPEYVSRAEYDKLKSEHEAMKQELDALKETVKQLTGAAAAVPAATPAPKEGVSEGKQVAAATAPEAVTPSPAEAETAPAELLG